YTQCADDVVRRRFIDAVLDGADAGVARMAFTVRGDFFDDVLGTRRLADALQGGILTLGPMSRDELRSCIEGPAGRVGLSFESGLVERLLDDVEGGAGSLPLLAFVLVQLWEHRHGDTLVHDAYDRIGGLQGALAQRAEAEFAKFAAPEQAAVRSVILELVRIGPGTVDAGRRATRDEIGDEAWRVVLALADARLLVTSLDDATDAETVEVAHEALIRNWGRLRTWLDEDREFLLWRQRLHHAIEEHARPGAGGDAALLRGGLLEEAQRWCALKPDRLSDGDLAFVATSARHARAARARRYGSVAGLAVLALGIALVSFLLVRASAERRRAFEARILDSAVAAADPAIAALLIAELDGGREPRSGASMARRVADRAIPLAILDRGVQTWLTTAAIAPGGERVLAGYADGAVLLWPADGRGLPVQQARFADPVFHVTFDESGIYWLAYSDAGELRTGRTDQSDEMTVADTAAPGDLMFAGFAGSAGIVTVAGDGTIRAWQPGAHTAPRIVAVASAPVVAAQVASDGSRIAVATPSVIEVWSMDGAGPLVLTGLTGRITSMAFDSTQTHLLTGDWAGTVRLWNVADGNSDTVRISDAAIWSVGFHPRSDLVLSAGRSGGTCVTSPSSDDVDRHACVFAGASSRSAVFSADGRAVALTTDSAAALWNPFTNDRPIHLTGHTDVVVIVQFSADDSRLITGSLDGTVRVWRGLQDERERTVHDPAIFRAPGQPNSPFWAAALDAAGETLGLAAASGVAWVWRPGSADAIALRGHHEDVLAIALDAAGQRVATGSWDATARVWDPADGRELAVLTGHDGPVRAVGFSPVQDALVTASEGGTVRLASGTGYGTSIELYRHGAGVRDIAVFPDGSAVATASMDRTAAVIPVGGTEEPIVLHHRAAVRSVDVSADGSLVVTASDDGTAIVWNAAGGDTLFALRHDGAVVDARFDRAGTRVVTASADRTARVWELGRGGEQSVLHGHDRELRGARFSEDGRFVVTFSIDSTALVHAPAESSAPIRITGHNGAIRDGFFLPGNEHVVTVSEDGSVRSWHIGWRLLHERLASATSACLPAEVRASVLGEPAQTARTRFDRCERANQRAMGDTTP
ncbi:MAG: hypothetical protein L0271_00640, partial [Gemmatimonadetes bacterium]|nr:hypothetical protein [Gemmatimonadota bacterium]